MLEIQRVRVRLEIRNFEIYLIRNFRKGDWREGEEVIFEDRIVENFLNCNKTLGCIRFLFFFLFSK